MDAALPPTSFSTRPMLDRSALCRTAAMLARRAVVRMGGKYADHLANCMKLAWMLARRRVLVATAAAAVAAVTPAIAQEPAMTETAVVETVPAYTAENTLRAALGTPDGMRAFYDAHRAHDPLMLGKLLDDNATRASAAAQFGVERLAIAQADWDRYLRRLVTRMFGLAPNSLDGITA